jgi:hypothetical protein
MHRANSETAAQHRIRTGMAEQHSLKGMRLAGRLKPFDAAAQVRKRVRACADHAPLLENNWTASGSWNEPEAGSFVHGMF